MKLYTIYLSLGMQTADRKYSEPFLMHKLYLIYLVVLTNEYGWTVCLRAKGTVRPSSNVKRTVRKLSLKRNCAFAPHLQCQTDSSQIGLNCPKNDNCAPHLKCPTGSYQTVLKQIIKRHEWVENALI